MGVSRKQAFGIVVLTLATLMFGGSLIDRMLLAGIGDPLTISVGASMPVPNAASGCVDSDTVQCPLWKANGDCTSNQEWMRSNCRLSCGVCLPPPTKQTIPCKDSDKTQCPLWAQNGDCEKNSAWMKDNCPRSCKVCTISAKVIYDGAHPESSQWDGYLPTGNSNGCKADMPFAGEPSDNCRDLCADTPQCKCVHPPTHA